MSHLGLFWRLPVVVIYAESIFEFIYLRKYSAKIKNIYTLVCGPQDVLLDIKKRLKKWVRWTVFLRPVKTNSNECFDEGLSNHTTFRPFWAGETEPLTYIEHQKLLVWLPAYGYKLFQYVREIVTDVEEE